MDKTSGFALIGFLCIVLGFGFGGSMAGGGGGGAAMGFVGGGGGGGGGGAATAAQACNHLLALAQQKGEQVKAGDLEECIEELSQVAKFCKNPDQVLGCFVGMTDLHSERACRHVCEPIGIDGE